MDVYGGLCFPMNNFPSMNIFEIFLTEQVFIWRKLIICDPNFWVRLGEVRFEPKKIAIGKYVLCFLIVISTKPYIPSLLSRSLGSGFLLILATSRRVLAALSLQPLVSCHLVTMTAISGLSVVSKITLGHFLEFSPGFQI